MSHIVVVGAGLAGCEAAWAAANAGAEVTLYEMKPNKYTPAHNSPGFAELVCSNSLKAKRVESAAGLLKEEMRRLGSICTEAAAECSVPAGGALAVDRDLFSEGVTRRIMSHPCIRVGHGEITDLDSLSGDAVIIATGPLTPQPLSDKLCSLLGGGLSFYDAAAPIISADSIDMDRAFIASRYGRDEGGEGDYINCPMNKEEYEAFHSALILAQTAPLHSYDKGEGKTRVYEGCMPIEVLAKRGADSIRYGPMKPVGLRDPKTGHRPWAVLQLRKENTQGSMLNMVGFQTNLKYGEQKRVFGMIPALKNAEFLRFGIMHRNTFIDSPRLLNQDFSLRENPRLFFAGQMTGVEGYMESAASGLLAGINGVRSVTGKPPLILPDNTMMGALSAYISNPEVGDFQPMGANFGLLPPLDGHIRDKRERQAALAERSLKSLQDINFD
ncbi:MAG: methylenetetrahydrofolate--tRNA-(uracil(54)-C(5))-methyltransferase (FADH(2)-oxidizing) TrmFO [Oscillospiraceae bacterium]|nr:methylenetetrahydrofolate--tRNA-(uracil(54)-C(5))-methyltransferase (FADH(2)-oxidizing) TrmFO [Oscillospiraceae bacterium]